MPCMSLLQHRNVKLLHLEHRIHHPIRFLLVVIPQQIAEDRRNDLPRYPKSIFQPAALFGFSAGRKLFPEIIDLNLCLTPYEKRDRRRERELRPAVQRDEFLVLWQNVVTMGLTLTIFEFLKIAV